VEKLPILPTNDLQVDYEFEDSDDAEDRLLQIFEFLMDENND